MFMKSLNGQKNNMNWSDVCEYAYRVGEIETEEIDRQEYWINGVDNIRRGFSL